MPSCTPSNQDNIQCPKICTALFYKCKGKGKVSDYRRIYTADYKTTPLDTTFMGDTSKQPDTLLCFPVLMHPGQESWGLWGVKGRGERVLCAPSAFGMRTGETAGCSSLKQPYPGLPGNSSVPVHHCQAWLLVYWYHKVCLEVTYGIFMPAPGDALKSEPDISLCKRKTATPESTSIELSLFCAGNRGRWKWEHHIHMGGGGDTGRGKWSLSS